MLVLRIFDNPMNLFFLLQLKGLENRIKAVSNKLPNKKNLASVAELRRRYALVIQCGDDRPQIDRHHPAIASDSQVYHTPHHDGEIREAFLGHTLGSQHFEKAYSFATDEVLFLPSEYPPVGMADIQLSLDITPEDRRIATLGQVDNLFRSSPTKTIQASHANLPRSHYPLDASTAASGMCASTAAGTWPPPALESLRERLVPLVTFVGGRCAQE